MKNEAKAKELLGVPIQWTFNYWLDGFSEATQKELREKRSLLIQMAEWKDQQFKKYMEKKESQYSQAITTFDVMRKKVIQEIIKQADSLLEELKEMKKGIEFLINEYHTNKRYFRLEPGRCTTEDVIKTVFEYAWGACSIFTSQKK